MCKNHYFYRLSWLLHSIAVATVCRYYNWYCWLIYHSVCPSIGITMRGVLPVLLCLLWSLVEVQSQTEYPYLTFRGNNLPNHSYVDITEVGQDRLGSDSDTVQCHTDLVTCCSDLMELPPGDWFPPGSDTGLGTYFTGGDMFQDRDPQVVHLRRRNSATGPTGIYRCFIATNATHNDSDGSVGETLYVGLYGSGGGKLENLCQYILTPM